jgi:ribonuclease Z
MPLIDLTFDGLRLTGRSRAGDTTWFRVHPPGLAFDAGRGSPRLAGAADLFISHGHLDHALGVPFVLSHRARHGLGPARVVCGREVAPRLAALIGAAARLEEAEYRFQVVPVEPGDRIGVGRDLEVEAFAARHGSGSLGFHLLRRRRRLLPRFRGLEGRELGRLRREGVALEEELDQLCLSYCGDTSAEVLDREPRLYRTPVLVLECTFLEEGHEDKARRYGHVHLQDLVARQDRFENRALVLHHVSHRHTLSDLRRRVDADLPALAERVHVVG